MEEEKGGERDTWRIGIRAKRQLPFQGWNATVCHGLTLEGWLHFPRYSDLTVSQTWYPVILYPFAYSSSTLFDSPIRRCFPFPACLSASPLFLLFFFLPPFSRACARNGRISSSKNRGRKTREGMTRGKRKTRILSCFPPPPRSSTRAARLSVTRPRFRGIRYGGGGEEDVVAEDVDRRVNSLWCVQVAVDLIPERLGFFFQR